MATASATRPRATVVTESPLLARRRKPTPSAAERMKREMIDEYGELDRQLRLVESVHARFDTLKRAIKSWFDDSPADCEATIEGKLYVLHVSPRERVRRIRDMQALALEVGHDELLNMLARYVPLGVIEDLIGKTKTAALVVDERSGSRRIKAVAKLPSSQIAPT